VGDELEESITIHNTGWLPAWWIAVEDESDFPGYSIGVARSAGAFIGILVGRTRWLILFNILSILSFGLLIGMQSIAKIILPNLDSFWIWLEYSNWQTYLFMERFQGWIDVILAGKIIYDQGFWEFLLIFISVVSSARLMFCLQRKINPILGLIPTLFSMGYSPGSETNISFSGGVVFLYDHASLAGLPAKRSNVAKGKIRFSGTIMTG
jgi:hypothetical protein